MLPPSLVFCYTITSTDNHYSPLTTTHQPTKGQEHTLAADPAPESARGKEGLLSYDDETHDNDDDEKGREHTLGRTQHRSLP